MRLLLLAVLASLPFAVQAQKATASQAASQAAAQMPLRASTALEGVRAVYDLHLLAGGGAAALVRIADHTGLVWFDADWRESRRVEYRSLRNGEAQWMAPLPDGGFLAAVETSSGGRSVSGLRVIDAQGSLQRLIPLAAPATALQALPGGDVLVATFLLQPDGSGVTQLLRLSRDGTQRWQLRIARAQVDRLVITGDAFVASASDPMAERSDRIVRGSLAGRLVWDRPLPWDDAASAAVERALGPDPSGTRSEEAGYARQAIVAAQGDGFVVFATGGRSFERILPLRYQLSASGEVTSGPVVTALREAWGAGRVPYSGWAPTAFPTGAVASADGSYLIAFQYQDADGEGFAALARSRGDGSTQRVWTAVSRDKLIRTAVGWLLVQSGRERTQLSLVAGEP